MDHLVDQLFVFEGDGQIRLFNGNYSDYRSWVEENELQKLAVPPVIKEVPKESSQAKRKASFKEKQEYEKLQEDIEVLEKQKATLTASIGSGSTDHQQLQKWSQEIQNVSEQIEQKTLRWLELAEIM
jgi:ATP-binding cassette subfamily F protein uup